VTPENPRPTPPRPYSKHGITPLAEALKRAGPDGLDKRTKTAHVLAEWRQRLIDDLGGKDVVTAQQRTIVDLACRSKLLVDSIDAWLISYQEAGGSLINKRNRSLLPCVKERQALADGLARYLSLLGLERRQRPITSLADYLQNGNEQQITESVNEQENGHRRKHPRPRRGTYPRTGTAPDGRFLPKNRTRTRIPRAAVTDEQDEQENEQEG
jgi:hypothetical protein